MPPFLNVPKDFLALPLVGTDCIVIFRQSDFTRPLILSYADFVKAISAAISGGGSSLLLQTNSVDNPVQDLLNLVAGSGITITDDGAGNITFESSGTGSVTADNGLTETSGNIQLGGTLLHDTTIDAGEDYVLLVTGARPNYLDTMQVVSTGDGNALYVEALKGYAIYGYNSLNWAANFETDEGVALLLRTKESSLNNNVQTLLQLSRSTNAGVGANGLGSSIDFEAETTLGVVMQRQARIVAAWSNATYATRTASLVFYTTKNGVSAKKLTIQGDGQLIFENYGSGTFAGTPDYLLGVLGSSVIEVDTASILAGYVPYTGATGSVNLGSFNITATQIIKSGGTSSQFLKADGSVDSNTYLTAAITSINSLTAASQTLTTGTAGTAPAVVSATSTHTINIPLASAATVTEGTISNTEYQKFNSKWGTYISTQSASSSATIDFTGLDGTYKLYTIVIEGLISATNIVELWVRMGTGSTPTWASGASDYVHTRSTGVGTSLAAAGSTDSKIVIQGATIGNASTNYFNGIIELWNPASASQHKSIRHDSCSFSSGGTYYTQGTGRYASTTAVTGLRILCSSGNITSGNFTLYGSL